jgi:uncharacterized protein YkwD
MTRLSDKLLPSLAVLLLSLAATRTVEADALGAVQLMREGGCGGLMPAVRPLRRNSSLDQAAALWATGLAPSVAAQRSGYEAQTTGAMHVKGSDASLVQLLRSGCHTVAAKEFEDLGIFHHGLETWLLFASPYRAPPVSQTPLLANLALQLVNEVRARGARCGDRSFAPAPPVKLSVTLGSVAFGHASDMAQHNYFEHQDLAGHSPADRVRAVGYRENLVGENIAYGPTSTQEVVQGWLDSPGHCENIMDPRFAEMGIAFAPGRAKRGLYWVQVLAAPRA